MVDMQRTIELQTRIQNIKNVLAMQLIHTNIATARGSLCIHIRTPSRTSIALSVMQEPCSGVVPELRSASLPGPP